ncbi:hypothetical protein ACWF9B_08680 [Streptomyces sp. NPDC055089]
MNDMSSTGPAFTEVKLTGPADEPARLMQILGGAAEVIFGPVMQAGRGGNVSCTAQVVTHPSTGPVSEGRTSLVTVQVELEVEPGVPVGQAGTAAAEDLEKSVAAAVSALPGIRGASGRLIAAVGLPEAQE